MLEEELGQQKQQSQACRTRERFGPEEEKSMQMRQVWATGSRGPVDSCSLRMLVVLPGKRALALELVLHTEQAFHIVARQAVRIVAEQAGHIVVRLVGHIVAEQVGHTDRVVVRTGCTVRTVPARESTAEAVRRAQESQ